MHRIVREAITRNVVWLLTKHPELSYIEPSDQRSDYRLETTFTASLTSYRLLMFSELFREIVHALPTTTTTDEAGGGSGSTSDKEDKDKDTAGARLVRIRDVLFQHHGAPPPGTAARVAGELRRLQTFRGFVPFLGYMKLRIPSAVGFSAFLRRTIGESVEKGYSVRALGEDEALVLRRAAEPGNGGLPAGVLLEWRVGRVRGGVSFFPGRRGGGGERGRGRGRGRKRGRGSR